MGCRNTAVAKEAIDSICEELGESHRANMILLPLDLASFESIHKFCDKVNLLLEQIDYLFNNAGIMMVKEGRTADGFELQFGSNHLGHFLLTNLLMAKILASSGAKIVNLSSVAHRVGVMHFTNLNLTGVYGPTKAYGQSKLANILFTRQLAKELRNTPVKVYAVHPGLVRTELYDVAQNPFVRFIRNYLAQLFFTSIKQGMQTSLYCALDPKVQNETGHYYR